MPASLPNPNAPDLPSVEHVKATTDFKRDWMAHGAVETLKWLEAGAPHKLNGLEGKFAFDMRVFVNDEPDEDEHGFACGTVCCIAGSIFQFSGAPNTTEWFGPTDLERFFRIRREDPSNLSVLFFAGIADEGSPSLSEIDAPRAARTLRHYLTTGEVDWHIGERA